MKKGKPYPHGGRDRRPQGGSHPPGERKNQAGLWLYGLHAVKAALANPRRKIHRLVLTPRSAEEMGPESLRKFHPELAEMEAISRLLPGGSVHQGAALLCDPLPTLDLKELLAEPAAADAPGEGRRIVVVLDQLTDPHNVGAILRSCAAFDVAAVIVQDRHAPPESGVLAKAASGALDCMKLVRVVNLARALDRLKEAGYWCCGLDESAPATLAALDLGPRVVLVLGSEGVGLRRLVRERCDYLARLPTLPALPSLNVSNAAAIALYELVRAETAG